MLGRSRLSGAGSSRRRTRRRSRRAGAAGPGGGAGGAAGRAGRPDLAYGCWVNAAGAAAALGDNDRALAFLDRADEGVRGLGLRGWEVQRLAARASILSRIDRHSEAEAVADAACEIADRAGQD